MNMFDHGVLPQIPLGVLHKKQKAQHIPFLKPENFCILKHIWPQGFEIKNCELITVTETNNLCIVLMIKIWKTSEM